jgi:hypothetical protein
MYIRLRVERRREKRIRSKKERGENQKDGGR